MKFTSRFLRPSRLFRLSRLSRRLSVGDQIYITRQLGVLTGFGLTLHESLGVLAQEAYSKKLKKFFTSADEEIGRGVALSNFIEQNYDFKPIVLAMVGVGEASGLLSDSLTKISSELARLNNTRKKFIGALIYPACVAGFAGVLVIGIVSFIFPKIIPVLQSVRGDLPLSTRFIIFITDFVKQYGLYAAIGLSFFIVLAIYLLRKFNSLRIFFEFLILHMPVFGRLYQSYFVSHILNSIGILISSDTDTSGAIEIVSLSTNSLIYKEALKKTKNKIIGGGRLSESFSDDPKLFPSFCLSLLSVGERTGSLPDACEQVSSLYNAQFESDIEVMTKLVEPAIMVILGLVVGFVAISIISPIYEITNQIRR